MPAERERWIETTVDVAALGAAAEYDAPAPLLAAAATMRDLGYRRLDAFTPYEVPELSEVLDEPRPRLPLITLAAGLTGGALAYLVQWWTNAVDYPIVVGGRPLHAAPAFVPITFETTILFAGVATFLGFVVLSRLTRLWAPIDEIDGFERATVDRFWLAVDGRDPRFDPARTASELESTGPLRVVCPLPGRPRSSDPLPAVLALLAILLPLLGACDAAGPEPNISLERMIQQPRYDPWEASAVFADGKVMREPPLGAIERGRRLGPAMLIEGRTGGDWATEVVPRLDAAALRLGRERFDIYCAPCHGDDGEAATPIAATMTMRPPPALVAGDARSLPAGRVFQVATEGYGLMPSYGDALTVEERWAVVAWVQVLQLRHGVPIEELPATLRQRARRELAAAARKDPPRKDAP